MFWVHSLPWTFNSPDELNILLLSIWNEATKEEEGNLSSIWLGSLGLLISCCFAVTCGSVAQYCWNFAVWIRLRILRATWIWSEAKLSLHIWISAESFFTPSAIISSNVFGCWRSSAAIKSFEIWSLIRRLRYLSSYLLTPDLVRASCVDSASVNCLLQF